jgi:hypothetical protein
VIIEQACVKGLAVVAPARREVRSFITGTLRRLASLNVGDSIHWRWLHPTATRSGGIRGPDLKAGRTGSRHFSLDFAPSGGQNTRFKVTVRESCVRERPTRFFERPTQESQE